MGPHIKLAQNKSKDKRSGFTIIEVVLVLAIAGLIFLMVFIALPALQRQQRNTQRKNDLAIMKAAIMKYYQYNKTGFITDGAGDQTATNGKTGAAYDSGGFCYFYNRHLKDLKDPSTGQPYRVILWYQPFAIDCTTGETYPRTKRETEGVIYINEHGGRSQAQFSQMEQPGDIQYNNTAVCEGEVSLDDHLSHTSGYSSTSHVRTYTIRMYLEGGSIACIDAAGDL